MIVSNFECFDVRHDRLHPVLSCPDTLKYLAFCLDSPGGREPASWQVMRSLDGLEFARSQSGIEIGAHLRICDLTHAPSKRIAHEHALVDHGLALKVLVPGKRQRFRT
jgi:hypothetical protein